MEIKYGLASLARFTIIIECFKETHFPRLFACDALNEFSKYFNDRLEDGFRYVGFTALVNSPGDKLAIDFEIDVESAQMTPQSFAPCAIEALTETINHLDPYKDSCLQYAVSEEAKRLDEESDDWYEKVADKPFMLGMDHLIFNVAKMVTGDRYRSTEEEARVVNKIYAEIIDAEPAYFNPYRLVAYNFLPYQIDRTDYITSLWTEEIIKRIVGKIRQTMKIEL